MTRARRARGPVPPGPTRSVEAPPRELDEQESLPRKTDLEPVLSLLRPLARIDVDAYKRSTLLRRVEHRLRRLGLPSVEAYVAHLQADLDEAKRLLDDLLIGVTSFFRDGAAFDRLGLELSSYLPRRQTSGALRAWVPGCATGEEAFSVAIVIDETLRDHSPPTDFRVFATDVDARALEVARAGVYPADALAGVSNDRIDASFLEEGGQLHVRPDLRRRIVFAPQDAISDPPFTQLDVVSCRNLFIYLRATAQRRLMILLHYALAPGGLLLLGASESIGPHTDLFEPVDGPSRLYRRKVGPTRPAVMLSGSLPTPVPRPPRTPGGSRTGLELLLQRHLFEAFVPATLVARADGEIVFVHGRTGRFMEPTTALEPQANVFTGLREELRLAVRSAMEEARRGPSTVARRGVRFGPGDDLAVDLLVAQLRRPAPLAGLLQVSFVPACSPPADPASGGGRSPPADASVAEMLEATGQELRSSNEELRVLNEELQAANDRLESSEEELRSSNEELHAINLELHGKIADLESAHDDIRNLLDSAALGIVFLDRALQIRRYNAPVGRLVRIRPADIGRPLADLQNSLVSFDLLGEAREVLRTLEPRSRRVPTQEGAEILTTLRPYRTERNTVDGVVITFVEVTSGALLQQGFERTRRGLESAGIDEDRHRDETMRANIEVHERTSSEGKSQ